MSFSPDAEATSLDSVARKKQVGSKLAHLPYASAIALFTFVGANTHAAEPSKFAVPAHINDILDMNCYECHEDGTTKGDVRLDNLDELDLPNRLELLNRVQEQVYLGAMPKKDKMESTDSDALLKWVSEELAEHKASRFEDKLRYYKYANSINHEKLFSGEIKDMPYTPARRWKINEYIYTELILNMYEIPYDRRRSVDYKGDGILPYGYIKPFSLPKQPGVSYYDVDVVGGGEFLTLLDNARYTANKQLLEAFKKTDGYVAPPPRRSKSDQFFAPGKTLPEFEKLVLSKGDPSDADLQAAISRQFRLALQREPSAEEMTQYLQFMKQAVKNNGVLPALEKMMVTVLMETDFLYRSEFGDGQRDAHGRSKLTPREASYALAYALTDRVPDNALVEAANSGRLSTKEDYKREVLRMLGDDSLNKPRLLRFFRDYFGYYNVFDVFKDEKRFEGIYNPHRASLRVMQWGVPGKVTTEADALVRSILKEDKDVLNRLLTTDKYFVHHTGDNAKMKQLVDEANEAIKIFRPEYERISQLKGDATKAAVEALALKNKADRKSFVGYFSEFNPALPDRTLLPQFFDSRPHAVKMYNIDYKTWSYEPIQPVKVDKRKGMLTHPAWLVSFSANAETDIIRRGKWIQEKLLGGIIPDVPITVEAKIPEAHDKTLRQRLASVTEHKDCWSCHDKMNPLGYPFEAYDDFGMFRSEEKLEHPENILNTEVRRLIGGGSNNIEVHTYKTLPVNTAGALAGTGDKNLDGEVKDAMDLIDRLSKSERVRQVFVRNVFRYFMGRNEMLSDSKTLIEADKAYVESGGSFNALVVSLLTSDSFMYRK